MGKKGLSIEIGAHKTRICKIDFYKKKPTVYKTYTFITPENMIEDGYIRDKEAFAAVLRKELRKAGLHREKDVIYTIVSSSIANREVTLPLVKEKQIAEIVKSSAQDYFPIDISDYTVAYSILEKQTKGEEKFIRLLLLAAPDSLIKNYHNFSEVMGFNVEAIDYVGNGSLLLLKRQTREKTTVTVQINEHNTIINIIEAGNLVLQRTVAYGLSSTVEAVMENEVFNLKNDEDARKYLTDYQVIFPTFSYEKVEAEIETLEESNPVEARKLGARVEVTDTLSYHTKNIHRLLDYYHTKNPDSVIDLIYITGSASKIRGIQNLFTAELGIRVVRITNLHDITFTRAAYKSMEVASDYMSVIGAAIAPLKFQSKEIEEQKRKKNQAHSTSVMLVTASVAAITIAITSVVQFKMAELTNAELNQKAKKLEAIEIVYNENVQANNYYMQLNELYTKTENGNEDFRELIEQLEKNLPVNMVVTSISGNAEGITINIETTTKISVAKLIMNLNKVDLLTNITVPAISSNAANDDVEGYVFSVSAQYAADVEETATETVGE